MDRATLQISTPPQVVTIGLDPAVLAALLDLRLAVGELLGEVRAQREILQRMEASGQARDAAAAEWDRAQASIAKLMMPNSTQNQAPESATEGQTVPTTSDGQTSQEGASMDAPEASTGLSWREQYAPLEHIWYFGDDGRSYMIRDPEQGNRPATPSESRVIRHFNAPKKTRGTRTV